MWFLFSMMSLYVLGMLLLILWKRKKRNLPKEFVFPGITIIVPMRNEAKNVNRMYDELIKQNYDHAYEIIFVDDNSEDETLELLNKLPQNNTIRHYVIALGEQNLTGKKAAIHAAVMQAKGEWLITVDADTYRNEKWLVSIASKTYKSDLLILPLSIKSNGTWLNQLQRTENQFLQALTEASFNVYKPILCNGANLAIRQDAWFKLYHKVDKRNKIYVSGDDTLLLDDFYHNKAQVNYVYDRSSEVTTDASADWWTFVQQRLRWHSKNFAYRSFHFYVFGAWVLLGNGTIWLSLILSFFISKGLYFVLLMLFIKAIAEFNSIKYWQSLMEQSSEVEFKKENSLKNDLKSLLVLMFYPFVILLLIVLNTFVKPEWKGRAIH